MPDSSDLLGKLHFEASTIETIDKSVLNYLEELNLFTTTNKGWKKVPVLWATSERAFLSKSDKDVNSEKSPFCWCFSRKRSRSTR